MSIYREIQSIKAQIIDTERLLKMVAGHKLMSIGLKEKIDSLKKELASFPETSFEPTVQLLFSGNAVHGSEGIKSSFIAKTVTPFQEMIKTQVALEKYDQVGKRGQTKKGSNVELYITALPTGSFGVELSQLEDTELFDSIDISNAMKHVMSLIDSATSDDNAFEALLDSTPQRLFTNLKRFLQAIAEEKSVLKMESNELGIEITNARVAEGYQRVATMVDDEREVFMNAVFRGLLLDSGKFEILDEEGKKISGFISKDLNEEQLVDYDISFLNKLCKVHLKTNRFKFKTGKEKIVYELLQISEIKE